MLYGWVLETVIPGETSDTIKICEFVFYYSFMFRDDHIQNTDENTALGIYLGFLIAVGPEIAKIFEST